MLQSSLLPFQAILWSTLFKYHLELGHCSEAYGAMMGNPDTTRCVQVVSDAIQLYVLSCDSRVAVGGWCYTRDF